MIQRRFEFMANSPGITAYTDVRSRRGSVTATFQIRANHPTTYVLRRCANAVVAPRRERTIVRVVALAAHGRAIERARARRAGRAVLPRLVVFDDRARRAHVFSDARQGARFAHLDG